MKKLLGLVLAVCLLASVMVMPVMARADLPFKDVKKTDWFYDDVDSAWMMGLINGKTEDMFMPDDNMTYAEAVKLAACMNQYYVEGKVTLKVSGDPWYDSYVEYCNDNGIIKKGYSWDKLATRAGYMEIFANSLPEEALKPINYIEDGSIPDVKSSAEYYDAVYKLYRAGILTGVDKEHNCSPEANIKRCEVAAIITRMMDVSYRQEFTMGEYKDIEKVKDKYEEKGDHDDADNNTTVSYTQSEKPLTVTTAFSNTVQVPPGNEEVTIKVKASGGKEPYTYEWYACRKAGKSTETLDFETQEAVDVGFHSVDYGDDGSFTFNVDGGNAVKAYPEICCRVTDDEGAEVLVTFELEYMGGGSLNDLAKNDFLMYVEDIFWIEDRGLVATGRVENGKVYKGDKIKLLRADGSEKKVTVEGIEMFKKMMDEADVGDNVGLLISGLGDTNEEAKANIERGNALVSDNAGLTGVQSMVVNLRVYSKEEGGRSTGFSGDGTYMPQLYIGTCDYTASVEYEEYDEEGDAWIETELQPSETYESVWLTLTNDSVFAYPGKIGYLREGGRTIAEFEIIEVFAGVG